jgi:hypothetical protein
MERSGVSVVNTFVYGPDLNNVEAELRALQQGPRTNGTGLRGSSARGSQWIGPIPG